MIKRIIILLAITVLIFNEQIVCRNLLSTIRRTRQLQPQPEEQPSPSPYSFNIESVDENGTVSRRQEQGDEQGRVTGQYSFQNPQTGIYRIVSYTSDENGFNARVETNEPGTITSNPANVEIISAAVQEA
ncbi:cuticle protein 10.9-like [Dermatophagoides pteronyssinus]|uniref:cuticle protein 10.9-like n=1 Tax=Dermatophagoides pteronyssinus TaxID=6956 RepID=UPI003F672068